MQQMFNLEKDYMLCDADVQLGRLLLSEIEQSGNLGQYKRNRQVDRKSRICVYLHNMERNFVSFQFTPSEELWTLIW